MVKQVKSFKLLGHTITVRENHVGEFESHRRFIEKNKPLFKYRGGSHIIKKPQRNQSLMKLPIKVTEAIKSARGTYLTFLMSKKLKDTDIDKYQNRIYVSKKETLMELLTEYEKQSVETQGKEGGLDLVVLDPRGEKYGMKLKFWASSNKYALIKEWGKLVRDNGLKKDDMVELWCFRADSRLHLVVDAVTRNVDSELRLSL